MATIPEVSGTINQVRTRVEARANVIHALQTVLTPDDQLTGGSPLADDELLTLTVAGVKLRDLESQPTLTAAATSVSEPSTRNGVVRRVTPSTVPRHGEIAGYRAAICSQLGVPAP
jgi:hypothetical protein